MNLKRLSLALLALIALAVLAALPRLLTTNTARSLFLDIAMYTMLALGLQLVMGYAGQISLGQGAFFAIGAYGYGLLTVKLAVPPWPAVLLAALLNLAIGYAIGLPILRFTGHQLALATIAFAELVYWVIFQATKLTGGPIGLSGIPNLTIANFAFSGDLRNAYLMEAAALVFLLVLHNLMRSRVGRALRALNANPDTAESLGVDVTSHKLHVFALSSFLCSIAGSFYAAYVTYISPDAFSVGISFNILLMAVIGGLATVWGAPIGAAFFVILNNVLATMSGRLPSGMEATLLDIAYGVILIAIMAFVPQGFMRAVTDLTRYRWAGKSMAIPADAAAPTMVAAEERE